MAVTKKDIADYLGISRTAVSLALNSSPKCTLSKETQEKIFQAAKKLGYMHASPATSSKKICCAFFFNTDNHVAKKLNGILISEVDHFISQFGYNTVYISVPNKESAINRFFEYIESGEAEGLIILNLIDKSIHERISQCGVPFVVFSEMDDECANSITPDSHYAAKEMVKKMIAQNHKRIAFFSPSMNYPQQKHFLSGYRDALEEAGIPFDPALVQVSSVQDGGEIAERMDLLGIKYTAALCANTHIQFGALNWLQSRGIKVPEQVSLLGYGMSDFASLSVPKLSVCDIVQRNFVDEGMKLLMEGIEKGRLEFPCKTIKTLEFCPGQTIGRCNES